MSGFWEDEEDEERSMGDEGIYTRMMSKVKEIKNIRDPHATENPWTTTAATMTTTTTTTTATIVMTVTIVVTATTVTVDSARRER